MYSSPLWCNTLQRLRCKWFQKSKSSKPKPSLPEETDLQNVFCILPTLVVPVALSEAGAALEVLGCRFKGRRPRPKALASAGAAASAARDRSAGPGREGTGARWDAWMAGKKVCNLIGHAQASVRLVWDTAAAADENHPYTTPQLDAACLHRGSNLYRIAKNLWCTLTSGSLKKAHMQPGQQEEDLQRQLRCIMHVQVYAPRVAWQAMNSVGACSA